MRKITDRQREVYQHYQESGSITQTAEYFDISRPATYKHINSVREKLKRVKQYRDMMGFDNLDEMIDGED